MIIGFIALVFLSVCVGLPVRALRMRRRGFDRDYSERLVGTEVVLHLLEIPGTSGRFRGVNGPPDIFHSL